MYIYIYIYIYIYNNVLKYNLLQRGQFKKSTFVTFQ